MLSETIPYSQTNYFSQLILDYLDQQQDLKKFYHRFPDISEFEPQLEEKSANYDHEIRKTLQEVLRKQYKGLEQTDPFRENLQLLGDKKTFTITTGHQLNLFTGPLYFLYKIISTINLCKELKVSYPEYNFVPVYWMATEDHDFEEINYFNLHGKKFKWNNADERAGKTAVGYLKTSGLDEVFELFSAELGGGENAEYLKKLFSDGYLKHENLTDATRFIANQLFGKEGLVILDAEDARLKTYFQAYAKTELLEQTSSKATAGTLEELEKLGYALQVNPREINLFYLTEELRERIILRDGRYYVHETEINWSREELLKELEDHPERFSPNVVMRPLYQEVILPNLCYIGGGGELAYWFELKKYFEAEKITFPILLLRNSALLQSRKQNDKRKKLHIELKELFLKQHELINRKVREISNIDINFDPQKEHLVAQFEKLYNLAEQTDPTFLSAVKAQEVKQLKGLDNLEKRLLKAQKRKLKDEVERISKLQNELFPNRSLQERQVNFSEYYDEYGPVLIDTLLQELKPLDFNFKIITFGEE
ncbi:MAG: bacillithiol biosynthesis cysteine-adding enzyme BshC [Bacteroidota bacterium]|nr:bacillithiol biosynthesis cysteine-adding enzyme BshC [Bacteroidota bacterium]